MGKELKIVEVHLVPEAVQTERLSDYVVGKFEAIPSRKGMKKAILRGTVLVDGQQGHTGDWVRPGQEIALCEQSFRLPKPYQLPVEVLYQDDYLAVVYKPPGIPTSGNAFRTLENALLHNLQLSKAKDAYEWPRPVHRLDSPTAGLLIVAKRVGARISLGQQLEDREIRKTYEALVLGEIPDSGVVDLALDGKPALTKYLRLKTVPSLKSGQLSWVRLWPATGRTHQLRRHLSMIGYPILGDQEYGKEGLVFRGKGLFLAATQLEFDHPITGEPLQLEHPPPTKFDRHIERTARRYAKFHAKK
jgi:23S rRNA pseudouridine1911/1915/1917 synthase